MNSVNPEIDLHYFFVGKTKKKLPQKYYCIILRQ